MLTSFMRPGRIGGFRRFSRSAPVSFTPRRSRRSSRVTTAPTDRPCRRRVSRLCDATILAARRVQELRGVHEPRRQRGSRGMESRIRVLFLIICLVMSVGLRGHEKPVRYRAGRRRRRRRPSRLARLSIRKSSAARSRNRKSIARISRVGAFVGIMSIEDFGSDVVYGARLAYHVTEGFFVEATVGQTEAGLTSFEVLSGGAPHYRGRRAHVYLLQPQSSATTCCPAKASSARVAPTTRIFT